MKALLNPLLHRAAGAYTAGAAIDDAMVVARRAASRLYPVTLCYWHQHLAPAEEVAGQYLALIRRLAEEGIDAHVGIKLPGLRRRTDLLELVIGAARDAAIPVDIDSHQPDQIDGLLAAVEAVGAEGLGVAIPGRWTRSLELAGWAVRKRLRVRVIKGGWSDPAAEGMDLREGFLSVVDALAGRCRKVAVATHDQWLAHQAFARLKAFSTPHGQELLYGYPMEPAAAVAREAGLKTRVYIPYGHSWVPYAMKRLLRQPRIAWWLTRDLASRGRDPLPKFEPAFAEDRPGPTR